MTNTLTRNEVIGEFNEKSYDLNKVVRTIEIFYSQRIPNFSDIIKSKIFEFEDLFEQNDKFFYSSYLGQAIINYFYYLQKNVEGYIFELSDTLSKIPKLFIIRSYFGLAFYIFVKKYKDSCLKLQSFLIKNEIFKILKIYFDRIEFYNYMPGEIYKLYDGIKQDLKDLNLFEITEEMDNKLLLIINKKEKLLNEIYEIARIDFGSDEKSHEYIKQIVKQIISDGKQKKR